MIKSLLLVGLGSFFGGVGRYLISFLIATKPAPEFPWATLLVNLAGSFLIGLVYGVAQRSQWHAQTVLLVITGILGGFTTFSAFSWEVFNLLKSGAWLPGIGYVLASVALGIGLAAGGYAMAR